MSDRDPGRSHAGPPAWLRRCLRLALPDAHREAVVPELDALYRITRERRGAVGAGLWYARQIVSFGARLRIARLGPHPGPDIPSGRPSHPTFAWNAWGRDAVRAIRRSPGWAAMTISCLAIGVAGVSVVFGVANWVLLRPVPGIAAPDELVTVVLGSTQSDRAAWPISHPDLLRLRERSRVSRGFVGTVEQDVHFATGRGGTAERVAGEIVTADYFEVLGVRPARGRGFSAEEEVAGAGDVVVVSDRLWALHWDRDPAAIGSIVDVNGAPITVIGVAPPTFHGARLPGRSELWFPPGALPTLVHAPEILQLGSRQVWGSILVRRADGAFVEDVAAELNRGMEEIRVEQSGSAHSFMAEHVVFRAFDGIGLDPLIRAPVERTLWLLGGAAGFLLLLACTNVANLGLLRSASLGPSIAVRRALGAGTARILVGRLVETCLLGLLGGVLGVCVAWLAATILEGTGLGLVGVPLDGLSLDGRVLGITIGAGVLAGALAGLGPALATRSVEAGAILGSARHGDRRAVRARGFLVVAQNALAVVLLVGAGLLGRTLANLRDVDLGIVPENVLTFQLKPDRQGYEAGEVVALMRSLLERLRARPDVDAATAVFSAPYESLFFPGVLKRPGAEWNDDDVRARTFLVTGGFFDAYGIELLAGRDVRDDEAFSSDTAARRIAVLNEAAARALFPGERPSAVVGRTFDSRAAEDRPVHVIGVVRDARVERPSAPPAPQLFVPWGQGWEVGRFSVAVRGGGTTAGLGAGVYDLLGGLDPGLPALSMITVERRLDELLAEERLLAALAVALAVLGAVLAALGLYGVLAYDVSQRTREIGIRSALGAVPTRILALVARTGVGLTAVGGLIGLAGAIYLSRFLESRLYGVESLDITTYATGGIVLLATALLATWGPARRALRVDPMQALRDE